MYWELCGNRQCTFTVWMRVCVCVCMFVCACAGVSLCLCVCVHVFPFTSDARWSPISAKNEPRYWFDELSKVEIKCSLWQRGLVGPCLFWRIIAAAHCDRCDQNQTVSPDRAKYTAPALWSTPINSYHLFSSLTQQLRTLTLVLGLNFNREKPPLCPTLRKLYFNSMMD